MAKKKNIKKRSMKKKTKTKKVKKVVKARKPARRPVKRKLKKKVVKKVVSGKKPAKSTKAKKDMAGAAEVQAPVPNESRLAVGQPAPDFRLPSDTGEEVSLSHFRGKKIVLYFYPKDDTPGCTTEACAFRDGFSQIAEKGAIILGVSPDSVASHQAFKSKFNLNFPLLSDVNKEVVQKYGVWKERSMYGHSFMGVERTTCIMDEEGRIAKIFPKVSVSEHYAEVLDALSASINS